MRGARIRIRNSSADQPCAALLEDLKQCGWLKDTLVAWVPEFGRMPTFRKGANGSDHNSAPWALLQAGYTQEETSQKAAAIQTFQQVCRTFPKDGHASTAHAHLQTKYKSSVTLDGAKDE